VLKQLATARGLSEKTARRYHQVGIDLSDPAAVEEHKQKLRTRRGVSKFWRKAPVTAGSTAVPYEEQLEDIIWAVHMKVVSLRRKRPELAEELGSITRVTGPLIDRFTEELL
jgi:hypothetical protein